MLKAYYFLWRRKGMTRDEFVDYYENKHVDLIVSHMPPAVDFRRNFPVWQDGDAENLSSPPFDVLTAITYEGLPEFQASMEVYHSPAFKPLVTEDELRFIDRDRVRFVPVDEVVDHVPDGEWDLGTVAPEGAKLLRLTRRPAGLDPSEFRTVYEASEVPVIRPLIDGCVDYRRCYIRISDPFSFTSDDLKAEPDVHDWDLVEEFSFTDAASAKDAAAALNAASASEPLLGATRTSAITCDQYSRTAKPVAAN